MELFDLYCYGAAATAALIFWANSNEHLSKIDNKADSKYFPAYLVAVVAVWPLAWAGLIRGVLTPPLKK